jgi:hypothetical protein
VAEDGSTIGAGLAICLASNMTSNAAVDEWIDTYPSLVQVDTEEPWFRPMMEVIGKRLLATAKFGAKLRLYMGATLSILDMFSDVNAIRIYSLSPEHRTVTIALVVMVGMNLGLQLFGVFVQTHRRGRFVALREVAMVLAGVKPAVDAWRVSQSVQQDKRAVFSPETELGEYTHSLTHYSLTHYSLTQLSLHPSHRTFYGINSWYSSAGYGVCWGAERGWV